MKCPKCGFYNYNSIKYCTSCGTLLKQLSFDVPPKEPTGAGKLILFLIIVIAIVLYSNNNYVDSDNVSKSDRGAVSNSRQSYKSFQDSNNPSDLLVKRCAREAGIPVSDPNHKITPNQMRQFTECIDRNM